MLENLLPKFGLTDREAKLYLAIVKYRKSTPAFLAECTKISRPTVYHIAHKLSAKGLIVEDLGAKTLYLSPAPPGELHELVKREEKEFKEKTALINSIAKELSLVKTGESYPVPKIRFIEEGALEKHLYARTPAWNESIMNTDKIWWGFQDHSFVEKYITWIDWYWKNAPKDLYLRLLSNRAQIEERVGKKYERRAIKPWSKSENFTATTWAIGDYIVMVVTNERPYYLVEISDPKMAHNYRELFRNLWDLVRS